MKARKRVGFVGGKFLPLHLGHIHLITQASNQVDELYVVLSSSKNRDKVLCEKDRIKYMPAEVRLSWLGKAFADLDNVKIIHIEDNQWNNNYEWGNGARLIKAAIGKPIDYIFSSEPQYTQIFKKFYPGAEHIVVDKDRKNVSISATEIRKDIYRYWDRLPESVKGHFTKKVAIVGTESCGKTTLAKKLAKYYNTNYVQEVGRDYCEKYGNQLTPKMFDQIAMEHYLLQQKKIEKSSKVLFIDSDAVITQYYLDMYFRGEKSSLIEEIIKLQNYDLVLYLEPDVKWVEDGLRFSGKQQTRSENNEKLKRMYDESGINYVLISGNYDERFNKAKKCIDELFEMK